MSSDSSSLSPMSIIAKNVQEKGLIRVTGPKFDAEFNRSLLPIGNSSMMTSQRLPNPFSQTSMLRRETSPMSMRSADLPYNSMQQSRSFHHPGRYPQNSMISALNARGRSPVESIRSIASNVSNASDIILALKELKCNKYELRNLKVAFNKFMKGRIRKSFAKRRNKRLFLKGAGRKSGSDSGDQASDSSLSSDDCRSTRTGITMHSDYRRNLSTLPKYSQRGKTSDDAQSTRTDIITHRTDFTTKTFQPKFIDLKRMMQDSKLNNNLSLPPRNTYITTSTLSKPQSCNMQNTCQKDRFKNGSLLPSQRFKKSTAVLPIPEKHGENIASTKGMVLNKNLPNLNKHFVNMNQNNNCSDSDEDEDILSKVTDPERRILQHPESGRKRNRDSSEESPDKFKITSKSKKTKVSSPVKVAEPTSLSRSILKPANEQAKRQNDFVFAKPILPIRKSTNAKNEPKAVNTGAASKPVEQNKPLPEIISQPIDLDLSEEQTMVNNHSETIQSCTSDVSMRPSFIKRKLYTQTLDVTEKLNNSVDSSPNASPQTKLNRLPKEKNKTRKVVTNQSCLSRDVPKEDDHLLDLIHKIVPPDRMNVTTNTTQKIKICPKTNVADASHNKPPVQEERWDVTSIISTCNNDQDVSDTFTDEEMFIVQDKNASKTNKLQKKSVNKSTVGNNAKSAQEIDKKENLKTPHKEIQSQNREQTTRNYAYAHRFWQTDSDTDYLETPKQLPCTKINKIDKPATKAIQEHAEIKKSRVAKNIKALLEITGSSDGSLEDIGKSVERVATNKSLRIRAAKALKENSTNSSKPLKTAKLRKSISNILAKDNKLVKRQITPSKNLLNRNKNSNKNEVNGNTSYLSNNTKKNNENKTAQQESNAVKSSENNKDNQSKTNVKKGSHNKNAFMNKEPVRKVDSNTKRLDNSAAAQDKQPQKKIEQVTKYITTAPTNTDDTQVTKPNLNVSKRGRLRKLTTLYVSPTVTTKKKYYTKTLRNTPNADKNKDIRTRVLEKTTEEKLNVSKRGRPRKVTNVTLSPLVQKRGLKSQQKVPEPNSSTSLNKEVRLSVSLRSQGLNKRANTRRQRKLMDDANKENISNNTSNTDRQRNKKSFTCCEDSRESLDYVPKIIKPQTNNVPNGRSNSKNDKFVLPIASATLALVPDSPAFRSVRQKAGPKTNPVVSIERDKISGAFSLGFATATIGIDPRHCATKETYNKTYIDDNMTVRSVSSVSNLSRSRRPRFLHVF